MDKWVAGLTVLFIFFLCFGSIGGGRASSSSDDNLISYNGGIEFTVRREGIDFHLKLYHYHGKEISGHLLAVIGGPDENFEISNLRGYLEEQNRDREIEVHPIPMTENSYGIYSSSGLIIEQASPTTVHITGTIAERYGESSLIQGEEKNFPFDQYKFKLFVTLLSYFESERPWTRLSSIDFRGDLGYRAGSTKIESASPSIFLKSFVENAERRSPENKNILLGSTQFSFIYETVENTRNFLTTSWVVFSTFILLGLAFFALSTPFEKKKLSLHIIVASAFLVYVHFNFYFGRIPDTISSSIAHKTLYYSAGLFVASSILTIGGILKDQYEKIGKGYSKICLLIGLLIPLIPALSVVFQAAPIYKVAFIFPLLIFLSLFKLEKYYRN